MAKRVGGFIGQDGINAPDPATGVTGTAGDEQVDVSFTPPVDAGGAAVTEYRVTDSTGTFGATGSASPITVTGLTNGSSYTFNVWAINPFGWSSPSDASGSVSPSGLFALMSGGGSSGVGAVINKILIAALGNATDFGDLSQNVIETGSVGGETRALMGGGGQTSSLQIDYVTFATEGNGQDFGDLTVGREELAAAGNTTRGIFSGGSGNSDVMDYVAIATLGNAADFGNLTLGRNDLGGLSSSTRAVFGGGTRSGVAQNILDYVSIGSTGNATDFGDLAVSGPAQATASSGIRGLFMCLNALNTVNYITIASTGNAIDFGDAGVSRGSGPAGASSDTRALLGGGYSVSALNSIEYFTIASTGNGTDFGDLTLSAWRISGCSNAHGGLQ